MSQSLYTQIALVKNPYEVVFNLEPGISDGLISHYQSPSQNYPRARIILPGFINLHAHLAYGPSQESRSNNSFSDIFDWLYQLVEEQFAVPEETLIEQHIQHARQALASGTTYLVDNSRCPSISLKAFQATGLRGLIGLEIFASDSSKAQEIFDLKMRELETLSSINQDLVEFCLAPHATYNVSPELLKLLITWAQKLSESPRQRLVPKVLLHAAESESEEAWFKDHNSALAQNARKLWHKMSSLEAKLKYWRSYPSSIEMLAQNQVLDKVLLLTHLCCASDEDLRLIAKAGAGAVSCPRSNKWLRNPVARRELWTELGIEWGLGTDSLASNHDLDLRQEVQSLTALNSAQKLDLLTRKAAKLLGKDKTLGSLELAKAGDYIVLELEKNDIDLSNCDPLDLIFDTELTKVTECYVAGKQLVLPANDVLASKLKS